MSSPGLTKIKERANEMIDYELKERKGVTEKQIGGIYGYLASEGALSSSSLVNRVQDFCINELKYRSNLIIKNIFKAIENTNIESSNQVETELVNFATEKLTSTLDELNRYIDKSRKTAREEKTQDLKKEFQDEVRRMSIECEDFLLKREKLARENKWYKNKIIQAAIISAIALIVVTLVSRL